MFSAETLNNALGALAAMENVATTDKSASANALLDDVQTRADVLSSLSTEELVKRALNRFMRDRNTDAILRGLDRSCGADSVKCAAALTLIGDVDEKDEMIQALQKRAFAGMAANAAKSVGPSFLRSLISGLRGGGEAAVATGRTALRKGLTGAGLLGAGAVAGQVGTEGGVGPAWTNIRNRVFGAPDPFAGHGPMLAQQLANRGDSSTLIALMRAAQAPGGPLPDYWLEELQRALAYRRYPWAA